MKLESLIVTAQQEHGLAAFRAQQDEQDSLKDKDFFGWYTMWTYENGFFNDTNEMGYPITHFGAPTHLLFWIKL